MIPCPNCGSHDLWWTVTVEDQQAKMQLSCLECSKVAETIDEAGIEDIANNFYALIADLNDFVARCKRADRLLRESSIKALHADNRFRLGGKSEGVRLAIDYIRVVASKFQGFGEEIHV